MECGVDSDGDADLVKLNFTKEINFNELHVSVFVCMQVCRIVVDLYMLYVVQYRVVIFLLFFSLFSFQGHSIQQLLLHPTQRKLLVHSLNNSLMMIDLRV